MDFLSNLPSLPFTFLTFFVKNRVYVQRTGLSAGLKRRGGLGFLPWKKPLSPEHQFLLHLDLRSKTVYDVGGHIGLLSMFFAKAVEATGNVITFEPNPQNYAAILDHIKLNNLSNISVIQIGLGRREDTVKFVVPSSARGTAAPHIQRRYLGQKNVEAYQIKIDTMDNQIAIHRLPKPDFVKIDVEGLELDVLFGMSGTIQEHHPELLIELHHANSQLVVEYLLAHAYQIYQIENAEEITLGDMEKAHGHLYAYQSDKYH